MPPRSSRRSAKSSPAPQRATAAPAGRREWQLSERVLLWILLAVHLALGLAYGRLVPRGKGPDEPAHLLFVQTLAGQAPPGTQWRLGLPVMQTTWEDPNFEVHQPPLYYLLATPLYLLGAERGVALLSLLCSLLAVWLVWRCVRELAAPDLALGAAAVAALWPMQAYLSTRANNDLLATALWALCLWLWARGLRDGPSPRLGWQVGLALGAALLTKQTSLTLVVLAFAAFGLQGARGGAWRGAAAQLAITLGTALLICGSWYLRNHLVYGDPFAQAAFDERFLTRRATPETLAAQFRHHPEWSYWPYVLEWTLRSGVIYLDQSANNLLPNGVYPLQAGLSLAAIMGAVWWAARRASWRPLAPAPAWAVLAAVGLVVVGCLYVQFNQHYFQAQGRYFLGLLPALSVLLSGGLSRPWRRGGALARYGLVVVPLWFALLNLLLLLVYLPGLYDS